MRRRLAARVEALPPRALDAAENRALERAIGLALTPQERLDWLDETLEELTKLCGSASLAGDQKRIRAPRT